MEIELFFILRLDILTSLHFQTKVVHQMQYKKKSKQVFPYLNQKRLKCISGFIFIYIIVKNKEAFRSSIFENDEIKYFLFNGWLVLFEEPVTFISY